MDEIIKDVPETALLQSSPSIDVPEKKAKVPEVKSFKVRPCKRKPGFHGDMFHETSYYFKKGLRYVYPYKFTFTAYIKQRWLNLKILDLFKKEFHMETVQYYEAAIKSGKIRVNDQIVSPEKVLKNNEVLKTTVHRHEPPVIHEDIVFLQNNDDMAVINKPSSIPVHPCGRYRHNTIVFLLGKEYGLDKLHTIHRIDRLTSGILMFAKTASKAREMEKDVKGRNVEKEYLARVVGEFPSDEITLDEPIITASHKIGVCHVHPDGKPCSTKFKRLSYNGHSSVVSCKPHTGRMHQIRVHLQWLGYPIINDPIYNHPTAWGVGKGKKGTAMDIKKVIGELIRTRKDKSYELEFNTNKQDIDQSINTENDNIAEGEKSSFIKEVTGNGLTNKQNSCDNTPLNKKRKVDHQSNSGDVMVKAHIQEKDKVEGEREANEIEIETNIADSTQSTDIIVNNDNEADRVFYTSLDIGEDYHDKDCTECKIKWKEPFKSELVMYLHALHYKGPTWEYRTLIPNWANDDWKED